MELSTDLKEIELEIKHHKNIAGQSIWEIGRRLNHVKENDLVHGEFINWLDSVEIEHTTAKRMMKVAKEIPNSATLHHLGESALYLIATLPEEERENTHTLESGEVKEVDEMTVRELQEVKRALKLRELEIQELKNRPKEVVRKEVIKEVEPEDYQQLKRYEDKAIKEIRELRNKVEDKNLELERATKQKESLERKVKLDERDSQKYRDLKSQIENLSKHKNDLSREIKTKTELSGLAQKIEIFLKTELAPIKYSRAIRESSDDKIVNDNLKEIIDRVQSWCDEMYTYVKDDNIIETEVIYHE